MTAYIIGLACIGVLAVLILWYEKLLKRKGTLLLSLALIAGAMVLRGLCMEHETLDYRDFLSRWVQFFRDNGGVKALSQSVGNYNVPYLYFLALASYSPVRDLYLIKLFSVLFDVALAWGVLRLSRRFAGVYGRLIVFFAVLYLPTVILNGAYWGQCDSVYAAFAVWSIVFALEDKPVRSVAAIALSFAFKLQAVFLMPVFLIFIFARKMKWYHLGVFPLTYLIVVLPAIIAGRPPLDTLLLYWNQAGTVGSGLNYNSPSMYALVPYGADTEGLSTIGIAAAFAFLLLLFILCWFKRKSLDDTVLFVCALLISTAVPFLLPHMHDRYFFIADVLSPVFAIVAPLFIHVPVCVSFASLMGYHAYLLRRWFLDRPQSLAWGAFALLIVLITLVVYLFTLLSNKKRLTNHRKLV